MKIVLTNGFKSNQSFFKFCCLFVCLGFFFLRKKFFFGCQKLFKMHLVFGQHIYSKLFIASFRLNHLLLLLRLVMCVHKFVSGKKKSPFFLYFIRLLAALYFRGPYILESLIHRPRANGDPLFVRTLIRL